MIFQKKCMAVLMTAFVLASSLTAAEIVKNGDFENGTFAPWYINKPSENASLSIITDSELSGGGSGALGITFDKERRTDIRQDLKAGPGKYRLSMYIDTTRCSRPSGYVMVQVTGTAGGKWAGFATLATSSNSQHNKTVTVWKKFEKIFTVPEDGMIKTIWITLVDISGTVMVDRVSLRDYDENEQKKDEDLKQRKTEMEAARAAAPQAAFRSVKYKNLFRPDEIPEQVFELTNPAEKEASVEVRFVTTDYFGKPVLESEKEFRIPAKGEISEVLRFPECRLPGFYCVSANWRTGEASGELKASFVKVGPVPEKKDPLFGITHYFGYSGKNAELMESLAVGSKGVVFHWNWYLKDFLNNKPETFEKIRLGLEDLKRCGIEPLGGLGMNYGVWKRDHWKHFMPRGSVKGEDPTVEELEAVLVPFIEKLVTLYKPYIRTWFLEGELDCGGQNYDAAYPNYVGMMKFTSETIRRIDPDAVIQGIGCGGIKSQPQFPMIAKLLPEVKDWIDGICPDIYPMGNRYGIDSLNLNSEENTFRPSMLKLVEMAKVTRKGYVSCAEGGPSINRSTPLDHPSGVRMANTEARQFILLKTVPNFRHWLYYKPDNAGNKDIHGWGMWEGDNPRQVVSAYAATARQMAFAEFVREHPVHQDLPCWFFRKDGKYFAALWYNGGEDLEVNLAPDIPAEAKDVQGNPVSLETRKLLLGAAPVYLYAESPEALEKLLARAADGVPELTFTLERQTAGKTYLMIRNKSGHPVELALKGVDLEDAGGEVRSIPCSDRFTLSAGEIRTVEKPVDAEKVTFRLETARGRQYTASEVLKPVIIPRVTGFAELEAKAVPQKLDDPARQISGYDDLKVHGVYTGLDDLSGEFRLGYDEQFLYLEVRVKDDVHMNESVPATIYMGDCIQFAIDANRDARMKLMRGILGYSDDDFNFVSALARDKPLTRCFIAPEGKRADLLEKDYAVTPEIIRDEEAKTTLYRVKIAFSDLAPLKPEKGRNFGFSMVIFDKDTRTSLYHMDYSPGVTHPFDPAKYPAFQFE